MILDTLANAARYKALHPGFAKAFEYLKKTNLKALPKGRNPIHGDRMYAMAVKAKGNGKKKSLMEAHRQYIDIQYAVAGTDVMGWRPLQDCKKLHHAFDKKGDYVLYSDDPTTWFDLKPGAFAIFYPWDAHAPMAATCNLHKVVVKVAVNWK